MVKRDRSARRSPRTWTACRVERPNARGTTMPRGFTLIELLVVILILGSSSCPCGLAFSSGLQATDTISRRLDNGTSRQLLASIFTVRRPCRRHRRGRRSGPGRRGAPRRPCRVQPRPARRARGSALFNLTPDPGANAGAKVTYWAVGEGRDIRVIRALCLTAGDPARSRWSPRPSVEPATRGTTLVTGLVGQTYCDARRCALTLNGIFTYTAGDRAAGVRVEPGRPGPRQAQAGRGHPAERGGQRALGGPDHDGHPPHPHRLPGLHLPGGQKRRVRVRETLLDALTIDVSGSTFDARSTASPTEPPIASASSR